MNPSRSQAIQQPTASVRKRIATGVITELISLQTGNDGRRSAWQKDELPESTFKETNKNEVNSRYKLLKSVEYIKNGSRPLANFGKPKGWTTEGQLLQIVMPKCEDMKTC